MKVFTYIVPLRSHIHLRIMCDVDGLDCLDYPLLPGARGGHHYGHEGDALNPPGLTILHPLLMPVHLKVIPWLPGLLLQGVHLEG